MALRLDGRCLEMETNDVLAQLAHGSKLEPLLLPGHRPYLPMEATMLLVVGLGTIRQG